MSVHVLGAMVSTYPDDSSNAPGKRQTVQDVLGLVDAHSPSQGVVLPSFTGSNDTIKQAPNTFNALFKQTQVYFTLIDCLNIYPLAILLYRINILSSIAFRRIFNRVWAPAGIGDPGICSTPAISFDECLARHIDAHSLHMRDQCSREINHSKR